MLHEIFSVEQYVFVVLTCLLLIFLAITLAIAIIFICAESGECSKLRKLSDSLGTILGKIVRYIIVAILFDAIVFVITGAIMFLISFIANASI